ncbi:hypothetical protein E0I74_18815 [Rhizobium laguerreae]|uniref:hypothetical protein n=1 Tax=Rhizobium laguerreae TaxID=1076926 RepID=UPI00103E2F2C|nr:hypothetical protein [Rhizobium laguerreae]MBY3296605.1 hypothetical protein [Rhizobium laguerreae]MBY3310292.1 hypothetical protein [Rhizobium laguerreae]MBY3322391.1 hypothetical protein [Rhizobium laguerreae]MBY3391455.1 hypothetical protein [Rhizobium laguerreae]MBY3419694.1 hypothetical protein [Rhizobium laguerreae]
MAFTAEQLVGNSSFLMSIRFLAGQMRGMFDAGPRLARLLASHQRWLLTQTAYALHLEHDPRDPTSGFTAVQLTGRITAHKVASRNTVLAFIEELYTYRFITHTPGDERRRPRHFEPADVSHQGMFAWLFSNLGALDLLDGGQRATFLQANPSLMRLIQPRIARHCLEDAAWREPPEQVALFLWTEAGGLVVDNFIARMAIESSEPDRLSVGRVETRALAADFMMSRTHLQRLLAKAAQRGCVGWRDEPRKTHLWISRDFVEEYCAWQAVKFAYVDEAFEWAKAQIEEMAV